MRATTEEQQISRVLERLVAQYPNRDPNDVAHSVEKARKRFEESRIRDFVPLLVERCVRAEFKA
ncbi:three-helix bundle dimerization domain-containing protein [Mycolicibacterium sp. CBMA 226]|uniref:three-helix bundle dimerization domain-containing protein n=1 Tax=Mycolicibacterium sp. CBMA 226 TaxID=2606611 RepID=UPI0012DEAC34|nr:hypothetical protein [Mycolicibacterium sp. CBMA 226]MUL79731.1 hypothetical protein [Mycolicibacterium sp. CBMA 226]